MNCENKEGQEFGVDLNRNWGVDFQPSKDACSEFYPGTGAFSEKETQALRDFMASKSGELKFVVNFHSNGNSFIWPFNGRNPNDINERAPGVLPIVQQIAQWAQFPPDLKSGSSSDVI